MDGNVKLAIEYALSEFGEAITEAEAEVITSKIDEEAEISEACCTGEDELIDMLQRFFANNRSL